MIRLKDVSYSFRKGHFVVKDMNLDLGANEFVAIMGRNGSGKSTLSKLISGLLLPSQGSVEIDGYLSSDPDHMKNVRKRVGLLLPSPDNQLIASTVEEDVAFGPENLGLASSEIKERVDTALSLVSMEDYRLYPPNFLSGGQKQLVCIAGLLAMRPNYMVLDEPTSMLDPMTRAAIMKTLERLHQTEAMGIILITHRLEEAQEAERIVLLDQGRIVARGRPQEIAEQVTLLTEVGIEPLAVSQMVNYLNQSGQIHVDPSIRHPEELVNAVCHLCLRKSHTLTHS